MNDALGGVQTVLALGGTSELALATLRALDLRPGAQVVLAGRDEAALAGVSLGRSDVTLTPLRWDARESAADPASAGAFVEQAVKQLGDVDLVLAAAGVLGDQERAEQDPTHAVDILTVNLTGLVAVLMPLAEQLRRQGHGELVIYSSVAGLRGRRANFVYGASKAGLDAFAEGLQAALAGSGAHVLVVRPGFVRTKMTAGMKEAPFSTDPEVVGAAVADAIRKRRDVVHVPRPLGPMFTALRLLPRPVFRKLPG